MATKPIRQVTKNITPNGANYVLLDDGVAMGKASLTDAVTTVAGPLADTKIDALNLGTASTNATEDFATAAQGATADSAVQPDDLAAVATTGSQDDMADGAANKNYTASEKTKLSGIEAGADVTDAANVEAAGAVMTAATDASSFGFFLDQDDLTDDDATKAPSQQSIKANIDARAPRGRFDTVAAMLADTDFGYSAARFAVATGQVIEAQGYRYAVAASGASDHHLVTAGGVKLYLLGSEIALEALAAAGDGTTDDSAKVELALTLANARNGRVVGSNGAVYRHTQATTIDRSGSKKMEIDLNGSELLLDGGTIVIGGAGSFLSTTLSADVALGQSYLPLTSVTGIEPGDLLVIESPALSQSAVNTVHAYVATYLDGNNVYIIGTVVADITAQQVTDSGKSGDILVDAYKLAPGFKLSGGKISVINSPEPSTSILVKEQWAPRVEDLKFDGHCRYQVYISYCSHDITRGCYFRTFGFTDPAEPTYTNLAGSPGGLSYGYGLGHARNYRSWVEACSGSDGWHVFDAARGQMYIDYIDCDTYRCGYGFATHECSWHVTYKGCRAFGSYGWQTARCVHLHMNNCKGGREDALTGTKNLVLLARGMRTVEIIDCDFVANDTGQASSTLYVDGSVSFSFGSISAGQQSVRRMVNCRHRGMCRVSFGDADADFVEMRGNRYADSAFLYAVVGKRVELIEEDYGKASQHVVNLSGLANGFIADGCRNFVAPNTVGSSAMFAVNGVPGSPVSLRNCQAKGASYLLRLLNTTDPIVIDEIVDCHGTVLSGANVTVNNMIGCTRDRAALADGGATVLVAENNVRKGTASTLSATATYDPPSVAAGALDTTQTMTVTGAALGDIVDISFSVALGGARLEAWVSAANTVSYRFSNPTASPIDLGSGTVRVRIRK